MQNERTCAVLLTLVATFATAGCASLAGPHPHPSSTFDDALHTCRTMQPNRVTRKFQLPPTDPRISACLERHGWKADGTQLPGES